MIHADPTRRFGHPPPTRPMRRVARALARAFLAGGAERTAMRERGLKVLGRPWPWLAPLVLRIHERFGDRFEPQQCDAVEALILESRAFRRSFRGLEPAPQVRAWLPLHPQMSPPALPVSGLPALATVGEVADWLELDPETLDWLADAPAWRSPSAPAPVEHYRYHWVPKRDGDTRLIEAPKMRLRTLQRRLLHGLLDLIPAHAAAMGCVRGRSAVDHARVHAGQPMLIKLDLRAFFPSIRAARVHALFRTLGYPREVARVLTGLTTHATAHHALRTRPGNPFDSRDEVHRQRRRAFHYTERHLPQGAPTSPALANLCAYRLDLRLAGAARECGARYSRYVDDLSFSGAFDAAHGRRILAMMTAIVREEGFEPNGRKAGVFPAATAQRVTGITINRHPNPDRREVDRLKAILTNCLRHGPASQNRAGHADFRAHLRGRIAWIRQMNPARADKLQALFARIDWDPR